MCANGQANNGGGHKNEWLRIKKNYNWQTTDNPDKSQQTSYLICFGDMTSAASGKNLRIHPV
jgi:hypothetical protein